MADTKTTKGVFNKMDTGELLSKEWFTQTNANWQVAEDKILGLETNIGLLKASSITDVFAFAESEPLSFKTFSVNPTTANLPSAQFGYASGQINYRAGVPYVLMISTNGLLATAAKSANGWSTWNIR